MDIFWVFIYGLIQGVTEFLPVSSSGHLAILPFFFNFEDPGVLFDLMMHLGTALAVILYFRVDIKKLILDFFIIIKTRDINKAPFVFNFLISTLCTFILILIIKKWALEYARNPLFIAFNLMFFGIIMWLSDKTKQTEQKMDNEVQLKKAVWIGVSQSFAIFPGVSRSGITMTISRFFGLSREEAGRFSFLLSLPIILGGILFKLDEISNGLSEQVSAEALIGGVIFSFVFGLLTIHFFLKFISQMGLVHFAVYRVMLALVLFFLIFNTTAAP